MMPRIYIFEKHSTWLFYTGKFLCPWMNRTMPMVPGMVPGKILMMRSLFAFCNLISQGLLCWLLIDYPLAPNPLFFDLLHDTGVGPCKPFSLVNSCVVRHYKYRVLERHCKAIIRVESLYSSECYFSRVLPDFCGKVPEVWPVVFPFQ